MKDIGKIVRYSIGKKYSIDSLCIRAAEGKALLVIDGWEIERNAGSPFYIRIDGEENKVKRSDKKREDVRETFGLPSDEGYYSFIGECALPPDPARVFLLEVGRQGKKPFFKRSLSIGIMLDEQKEDIVCCIDSVQKNGGKTYITGWGYSRALEKTGDTLTETLSELDISLKAGQFFLRREERNDVKVEGFPKAQRAGFVLRVEDTKDGIYDLLLKAPKGTVRELRADSRMGEKDYLEFRKKRLPKKEELLKQSETSFSYSPLISILVFIKNTDTSLLKMTIESLLSQSYKNFEICLCDRSNDVDEKRKKLLLDYAKKDERVKLTDSSGKGEFIALPSCGDTIEPDYLFAVVQALQDKDVDIVYTDEDRYNGESFFDPNFKSDFSMDLLRGTDYIGNTAVIRRSLAAEGEPLFDENFGSAAVYDLILRCAERAKDIRHIKRALYHRLVENGDEASIPLSEDPEQEAGRRAIEASLDRLHVEGRVENGPEKGLYITKYALKLKERISIIIPSHDHAGVLRTCIDSIEKKSTYDNYEILIIENGSTEAELFDYYESLKDDKRVKLLYWDKGFNYSAINNYGVREADGDYLLFLNNDIEIITPDWLEEMLSNFQRNEGIGAVGVKLLYPDTTIQHAGVIIRLGGIAGHGFSRMESENTGYFGRAVLKQDYSAVTAACMMTSRKIFEEVGGFEEELAVAFNDVDLCLKIRKAGYRVIYDPQVTNIHYESLSRGHESESPEKQKRFDFEKKYMYEKWRDIIDNGDPFYNPNLTIVRGDFSIRKKDSDDVRIF